MQLWKWDPNLSFKEFSKTLQKVWSQIFDPALLAANPGEVKIPSYSHARDGKDGKKVAIIGF